MNELYEKKSLNIENHSCANCGANLAFDPKTQRLLCPYCMSSFEVERTSTVQEKSIAELISSAKVWNSTEVIQCTNCGAKEIINKKEIATHCSFCGTTNIVKTSDMVGIKPDGICPFEKTLEEAKSLAKKWVKRKKFAPNSFKKTATIQSLKGTYAPAFCFDCVTQTTYDGRLGENHEKYYTDSQGRRQSQTYTTYFNISGTHNRVFDDLLVHSSATIPYENMLELEPYPTKTCAPYSDKYLAGYTATTYSKDGNSTWKDCQSQVSSIVRGEILAKYDYDVVERFNANTKYTSASFKYTLLPVYVGHHTFKQKNYNFYVNGSTGKISGKAPVSGWKVFFLVLGIAVGIAGLALLGNALGIFK